MGAKYGVRGPSLDQCVVDLEQRMCSCRKWEVTGLPCKHDISAIWNAIDNGLNVGGSQSQPSTTQTQPFATQSQGPSQAGITQSQRTTQGTRSRQVAGPRQVTGPSQGAGRKEGEGSSQDDDETQKTTEIVANVSSGSRPSKKKKRKSKKIIRDASRASESRTGAIRPGRSSRVGVVRGPHGGGSGVLDSASYSDVLVTPEDLKDPALVFQTSLRASDACTMADSARSYARVFLNMGSLQSNIDNNEFTRDWILGLLLKFYETQFQMFIKSKIYLNDKYIVMTRNYFLQYTQLDIPEFCETLVQFMEYVKKSIDERALHKEEYNSWVNERQMQTTEYKVDLSKALDASLVDTKSSRTTLKEQDISSRSGNDAHADDADIKPIYDEEPMVEVQTTAEINVFAIGQQHTEQPEFNNEGEVDQNVEQCHDTCLCLLQQRFASQVDVNNDLSKPVITHYLPKEREYVVAKPHHMIAPGSSRWVPTEKIFTSSTTKVDSEPPNGSKEDTTNQCESEQALYAPFLNVQLTFEQRSSSLVLHQMMSDHNSSDLAPQRQEMSVENVSSGLVPQGQKASDYDNSNPVPPSLNVVPTAEKTDSSHKG
ncbi:retrovirus-related pol polyprotein from transposon TNT 1-94 [Tanacetum coccineum]